MRTYPSTLPGCAPTRATESSAAPEEQRRLLDQAFQAQKLESLSRLADGLAHALNNLLVGVLTPADLLCRDLPAGGEQRQLADLIKKAAERGSELSRQMLLYAGKGVPARRPLALAAAAEDSLAPLAAALPPNIALVKAFAPDLPPVEADPAQLSQLVTHLVVNAAEALGPRGGCVLVATGVEDQEEGGRRKEESALRSQPPLAFLLPPSRAAAHVYLEVRDDGCGMSADVLPHVFDPFFTTKGKGRGLGLCAVLGVVRAHGGGLRAASAPGAGTSIRVLLPAAAPRAVATPVPRGVVLLIDHEPVVRGITGRALAAAGLEVLSAGGGREGLELLRARRDAVRLVLIDPRLPGPDGAQTLTALRAERPNLPAIVTGEADGTPDPNDFGPAPTAFLPKPYSIRALLEVVGRALDGRS